MRAIAIAILLASICIRGAILRTCDYKSGPDEEKGGMILTWAAFIGLFVCLIGGW